MTYVWTIRVAEKKYHYLAIEITQRALFAIVISEAKAPAKIGIGDICGKEYWFGLIATAC